MCPREMLFAKPQFHGLKPNSCCTPILYASPLSLLLWILIKYWYSDQSLESSLPQPQSPEGEGRCVDSELPWKPLGSYWCSQLLLPGCAYVFKDTLVNKWQCCELCSQITELIQWGGIGNHPQPACHWHNSQQRTQDQCLSPDSGIVLLDRTLPGSNSCRQSKQRGATGQPVSAGESLAAASTEWYTEPFSSRSRSFL